MKLLLMIRHAKSSWQNTILNDFDRPLNQRGHSDAPIMAKRMYNRKINVDCFISSTASRAYSTAEYFAIEYGQQKEKIIRVPELYHASPAVITKVIAATNNSHNSIAVFCHNPGITEFVNQLTHIRIDNMPTCGIFVIQADIQDWRFFNDAEKEFILFDYPKMVY